MGKDFCDGVTLEHICIEAKEFGRFSEIKDWTWNDLSPDISGFCQDARRYPRPMELSRFYYARVGANSSLTFSTFYRIRISSSEKFSKL